MSNPPEPCQCFKHDMFPSDSQRGSCKPLFTTRVGSAAYVIIGNMATATQRQNNTTKQLIHIRTTRNTYSDPSRIQSNIPKTLETLMNVT